MQKHIIKVLENYKKQFPNDEVVDKFLEFAKTNRNPIDRKHLPAHFTVSAIVINENKILTINHKALGISFQPGGHIEEYDRTVMDAAIREVREETGLETILKNDIFAHIPFLLDIHDIPENKKKEELAHQHYDMFFLLNLKDRKQELKNADDGTDGAKWEDFEKVKANSSLGKVYKKLFPDK